MLTCQEMVELVTDYLEGALEPARHAEAADHLGDCDDCLRYVAQLQCTRRLVAGADVGGLAPEQRHALLATYRAWVARRRPL